MYEIKEIEKNYYTASLSRSAARAAFPDLGLYSTQVLLQNGLRRKGFKAVIFKAELTKESVIFHIITA